MRSTDTRRDDWHFNERDRGWASNQFWRCPARLVKNGLWGSLWRVDGTQSGGGTVTSVLPFLALHTWVQTDGAKWTRREHLGQRRIYALTGVSRKAISQAFERLQREGLLSTTATPRTRRGGSDFRRTDYRLAAALYPQGEEEFVKVPGNLFYGGLWSTLLSPAERHLYIVLACLDSIRAEEAFVRAAFTDGVDELNDAESWAAYADYLRDRGAAERYSFRDLADISGLSEKSVERALRALLTPLPGAAGQALIRRGDSPPRTPTWYAPNRSAAAGHAVPDDLLNSSAAKRAEFNKCWRRRASGGQA